MQLDEHSRKIAALVAYNDKQIKEMNRLITLLNERVNDLNTFTSTLEREGKVVSGISYSFRDSVSNFILIKEWMRHLVNYRNQSQIH